MNDSLTSTMTPALPPLLPITSGWYGKLPSRGDFVGRGLPRAWLRQWDGWLQRSLAHAAQQLGAAPLRERLQALPPWQCLMLPARAGDAAWCGVLVASNDRVGRVFPLLVAESYDLHALGAVDLGALRERGWAMVQGLGGSGPRPALKELEAAITGWAAQPLRRPEPDDTRPGCAVDHLRMQAPQGGSFWWRLDSDAADAPHADVWPPSQALMLRLLGEPAPG